MSSTLTTERRQSLRGLYARAGVRPRYLDAEHPLAGECLAMVREGMGPYITGGVGTGKTHLASAVVRAYIDSSAWFNGPYAYADKCLITSSVDMLSRFRSCWSGTGERESDVLERFA
ncbi:MAG: hypothetical protein IKG69_09410, partial [Atopobiaceae bacterium]|nr:hypothetical protein [Atopobiaceae bacterium]